MLTHWVVDDNHAQACPEAPGTHMCKLNLCATPHRSTKASHIGQWLNW